ncbi:zinc finger protein 385C-like [Chanos chanos]|uniref:Zinc finger protein 385C-like n=1 Tax=Chanos chanos TaxID=29144 RepID=A0A6J2VFE0_CHACN|nr:zinc finger protein 385C-like [Chanos chanos]
MQVFEGMKRPFSPLASENGLSEGGETHGGCRHGDTDPRPKRERKQRTLTLCEVCNIQLNSSAQAQIHYNGKTHQRRLRQASQAKSSTTNNNSSGSPAHGSPLLASLPLPGRSLQPQLDLKHFLPLRVNGSTPLSLFPNFNTMDPVQKAVINHTFGVAQPLKKKQIISCNICHLRFNSTNQAEAHYKGHKHARKLKAIDNLKNKQRSHGMALGREREKEREQERDREGAKTRSLPTLMDANLTERAGMLCEPLGGRVKLEEAQGSSVMLTPISDTSSSDMATLLSPQVSPGSQGSESTLDSNPTLDLPTQGSDSEHQDLEPSVKGEENNPLTRGEEEREGKKSSKQHLHCPVCKVTVNSSSQLEAHYSGSKHKLMLEGQSVQPRRRGGKIISSRVTSRSKRHGNKNSTTSSNQSYHCNVCEIAVNSETQLKQHMSSRRHKDRLAGKPPKPKFSPYNKNPANSVLASVRFSGVSDRAGLTPGGMCSPYNLSMVTCQTKLALQKQLSKTLTAGFLPSPLTPATLCTMATNPLTIRHAPGPAAIIQTPLLSPALFRPAPGPLRATHTPIIFSPY